MNPHAWHALTVEEVARLQSADVTRGLSSAEALVRLAKGRNQLPTQKPDTLVARIFRQLKSPIAVVLLCAALATVFISDFTDATIIALALLVNVAIGIFQEGRAGRAFSALQKEEAPHAVIVRDGQRKEIPAAQVVPGDIIVLSAGAKVPADARLLEVYGLSVQEAALSGEWVPVDKSIEIVQENAPLVERINMVYAGTLVAAGGAKAVVTATGSGTELGTIAKELLSTQTTETPLQHDIKQMSNLLLLIVGIVVTVIGVLAFLRGMTVGETLLIVIAIAVAAIPEGLPAAVTVVLALGMERILKTGGLVRNLLSAETLGATSVILTDKTGTLTEGRMKASAFITLSGTTEEADGATARAMLRASVIASDGYIEEVTDPKATEKIVARGRPMEQAILLAGLEAGFSEKMLREQFPRLNELHFSSKRRFGGMLVREEGKHVAYITGMPELFLAHARTIAGVQRGEKKLTEENVAYFEEALFRAAKDGKRVIAVGKIITSHTAFPDEERMDSFLEHMEMLGFIVFSDVIRADARTSVLAMREAGARVIMLTGDNPETALWFARQVGIADEHAVAHTGIELQGLSDEDALVLLQHNTVFARVVPTDKLRIARVLTSAGEVVAMTGDGVNDAPALEAAAIGVALGSGTDVAKEASDLVLLNDSFSVITKAIAEGRRLRDNVKKICAYLLSTNFSEIFVITASLATGMPLPILPTQIMWANLIEGGPMNVALAFEPLYPSAMKRSPKHPDVARVLSPDLLKLIFSVGFFTGMMLVAIHFFLTALGIPETELRTVMFGALSASSVAGAISLKSFGTRLWKLQIFSNPLLLISLAGSVFMLLIALFVPVVQSIVHTVSPSWFDLSVIVGAGLVNLFLIEIAKELFFIGPARRRQTA